MIDGEGGVTEPMSWETLRQKAWFLIFWNGWRNAIGATKKWWMRGGLRALDYRFGRTRMIAGWWWRSRCRGDGLW